MCLLSEKASLGSLKRLTVAFEPTHVLGTPSPFSYMSCTILVWSHVYTHKPTSILQWSLLSSLLKDADFFQCDRQMIEISKQALRQGTQRWQHFHASNTVCWVNTLTDVADDACRCKYSKAASAGKFHRQHNDTSASYSKRHVDQAATVQWWKSLWRYTQHMRQRPTWSSQSKDLRP